MLTQFKDFNLVNADATDETQLCPWILPPTIAILSANVDRTPTFKFNFNIIHTN